MHNIMTQRYAALCSHDRYYFSPSISLLFSPLSLTINDIKQPNNYKYCSCFYNSTAITATINCTNAKKNSYGLNIFLKVSEFFKIKLQENKKEEIEDLNNGFTVIK